MLGLTTIGVFHTAIGLAALASGVIALAQDGQISPRRRAGRIYLVATLVTALTGFGIFQHGGFGPPHVLSVLTLVALAVGTVAAMSSAFGRASPYVQVVSYSITFLFHLIPGVTETSTRLPPGAPLVASAEAPELQAVYALLFVLLAIGLTLQIRRLRASARR
ncbi:hypothetical protein [Methylibium sp.]|uniref:hypothetical protein n=1 Tax=Methylibium sp. TaxID=2067992 RepID=UPI003D133C9F